MKPTSINVALEKHIQRHEQMFVPVFLLLVMAVLLANSPANHSMFLFLNQAVSVLPDGFWAHITAFADTLFALVIGTVLFHKHPSLLRAILIAAIIATIITHTLKPLLAVARPPALLAPDSFNLIGVAWHGASFPSGHSVTIATLLGLPAFYFYQNNKDKWLVLLFGLALFVGFSRVAVGVHWLADVLAGIAIGWFSAWLAIQMNRLLPILHEDNTPWYLLAINGALGVMLMLGGVPDYPETRIITTVISMLAIALMVKQLGKKLEHLKS